jgi:hypothetical protein
MLHFPPGRNIGESENLFSFDSLNNNLLIKNTKGARWNGIKIMACVITREYFRTICGCNQIEKAVQLEGQLLTLHPE